MQWIYFEPPGTTAFTWVGAGRGLQWPPQAQRRDHQFGWIGLVPCKWVSCQPCQDVHSHITRGYKMVNQNTVDLLYWLSHSFILNNMTGEMGWVVRKRKKKKPPKKPSPCPAEQQRSLQGDSACVRSGQTRLLWPDGCGVARGPCSETVSGLTMLGMTLTPECHSASQDMVASASICGAPAGMEHVRMK